MTDFSNILEKIQIDEFNINFIKNDTAITFYCKSENKLWEDWLEKYIKECYIDNTNMIDIGANIGTSTLTMSRYISKKCKIYSFEPVYYKILEMNIIENNLSEIVEIYPIGLSNKEEILKGGEIDFNQKANYGFTTLENLEKSDEDCRYNIYLKTLDSLNLPNISFIKLDVEGCERIVLEGAINTILKFTPTFLIEIWSTSVNAIQKFKKNSSEIKKQFDIFEFFFNLGYISFPITPKSDDFLFIHYKKKEILNKVINIL